MAYLALVWRMAGYSIAATRLSMLALAAATVVCHLPARRTNSPADRIAAILAVRVLAARSAVLHAIDDGAARHARHAIHRARPAAVPGRSSLLPRRSHAPRWCSRKETGALLPLIFHCGSVSRSDSLQVCGLLSGALRRARHLVLRALAHHRPHLRRSRVHAVQHHVLAEPGSRLGCAAAPLLTISLLPTSAGWARSRFSSPGSEAALYSTRAWKIAWCFIAAHILLVSLLGGADAGTLSASRPSARLHRDGRGIPGFASALAIRSV